MKKTKLIPFTIEAWEAGGKPVTRDGEEVKQLTHFERTNDKYCLCGTNYGEIFSWAINGRYKFSENESNYDLMLEVEDTEKQLYLVVINTPFMKDYGMEYNVYVSDNIEDAKTKENYLTHLKLPPCNS